MFSRYFAFPPTRIILRKRSTWKMPHGARGMETLWLCPERKKGPQPRHEAGGLEKKTGGALLSHAPGRSTIAAGALNVRVREGNGCDSPAKATGHKIGNRRRKNE